jgi:RNA polymerase sigma factor (sigma-70 family)
MSARPEGHKLVTKHPAEQYWFRRLTVGNDDAVNEATDTSLMRAVRMGRTSALAVLFERHHGRLYRFCLSMMGDRQIAEDLVQDTFMKILKYKKSFRDEMSFAPWMFRIARNACVDHLRRVPLDGPVEKPIEDVLMNEASAEDCAVDDERSELVRRALLKLPVKGREVLLLSRYEFKTYEEIAHVLGCSVSAAKVRAHRAMKQLREVYLSLAEEASI